MIVGRIPMTRKEYESLPPDDPRRKDYEDYVKELIESGKNTRFSHDHQPQKTPKAAQDIMKEAAYDLTIILIKMAKDPENKKQFEALQEVLNRVYGKPNQALDIEQKNDIHISFGSQNNDYGSDLAK